MKKEYFKSNQLIPQVNQILIVKFYQSSDQHALSCNYIMRIVNNFLLLIINPYMC